MDKVVAELLTHDVYKRACTFLYGTHAQITEYFQQWKIDCEMLPTTRGKFLWVNHSGGQCAEFLIVVKYGSLDNQIAALVHESLHVTFYNMQTVGIKLTDDSEESFTYYQEWLVTQCLAIIRKSRSRMQSSSGKVASASRKKRIRSGRQRRS